MGKIAVWIGMSIAGLLTKWNKKNPTSLFYEFVVDYKKRGYLYSAVGDMLDFDRPFFYTCKNAYGWAGLHPRSTTLGLWIESFICTCISEFGPPSGRLQTACPHFKTGESRRQVRKVTFLRSQVDEVDSSCWAEQRQCSAARPGPSSPWCHRAPSWPDQGSLGCLIPSRSIWHVPAYPYKFTTALRTGSLFLISVALSSPSPLSPVFAILLSFTPSEVCRDHNMWGRTRSQQPFHNCYWRENTGANE